MRDKKISDDTYNYKEHVYADPVALRKEIEQDKQKKTNKAGKTKKYEPPTRPPPLPSGARGGSSPANALYAELAKKTNVPTKPSVRDLGNRFGGTIPRDTSRQETMDDQSPPPVPDVTSARKVLDDSPPESPTVNAEKEQNIIDVSPHEGSEPPLKNRVNAAEMKSNETRPADVEGNITEETVLGDNVNTEENTEDLRVKTQSTTDAAEVVIDVRINSETGIEIGTELPETAEDTNGDYDGGDGAVLLIKSVKHDPFAVETRTTDENSNPERVRAGSDVATNVKTGSESSGSGSTGSGSVKRKKKKDLESGLQSTNHMRRNLIIISLFLLIIFILVLVAVGILISYTNTFS